MANPNPKTEHLQKFGFKPGQINGTPGRSSGSFEIARLAREMSGGDGRKYLEVLDKVAMDDSQKTRDRVMAATELLNRGFGKPLDNETLMKHEEDRAKKAVTGRVLDPSKLSTEQLQVYWGLIKQMQSAPLAMGIPDVAKEAIAQAEAEAEGEG